MIDLIKKIEGLKEEYNWTNLHSREYVDIKNDSIDYVLEILNQYNIITAPKEIKLSEIFSKLKKQEINVVYNRKINAIGKGEYDESWFMNTWETLFRIDRTTMKIKKICIPLTIDIKWLYELWIAGTTIIDDLEE